jgi:hypothetical protein
MKVSRVVVLDNRSVTVNELTGNQTLLLKEEYEDHVWFEDRWMVTSLCDE